MKGLEDRIDRVESGQEKVQAIPKASGPRLDGHLPPPPPKAARKGTATSPNAVGLFDAINNQNFKLKKAVKFRD